MTIPLECAVVLWTQDPNPQVHVIALTPGAVDDAKTKLAPKGVVYSDGAVFHDWKVATDVQRLTWLHELFVSITATYGVPPKIAHQAFLSVDGWKGR